MDYAAFLRHADRGTLPPVLLLHGGDGQLLDDALGIVTRALFPEPSHAVFDREVLDGREVDPDTVARSASTLPIQAARRLIVVRHAQALPAKGSEPLARYLADPNPSTCLLLLADEALGQSRERKAAHWLLAAATPAAIVELVPKRGRALEDWLRQRAEADGIAVSGEAVRLLVQWVGDDAATLLGEVRKAALAAGRDARAVGVKDVTAVVGERRLSGVFDLTRAIERRDVGLALRTLDSLLGSEEPLLVLAMLVREVRTAWSIQAWRGRGQSVDQIAGMLRRPTQVVEALAAAALAQSPSGLAWKLRRCWEVETRLKSGGEPRAEMAMLVADLCGAR